MSNENNGYVCKQFMYDQPLGLTQPSSLQGG